MSIPCEGQQFLNLARSKKPFYFKPKEKDVERSICDWLRIKGYFFWKQPSAGYFDPTRKTFRKHTSPYVKNGVSDILLVINGELWCIEVKSATGRQSEAQRDFERDVRHAGAKYLIARSVEDIENALKGKQQ